MDLRDYTHIWNDPVNPFFRKTKEILKDIVTFRVLNKTMSQYEDAFITLHNSIEIFIMKIRWPHNQVMGQEPIQYKDVVLPVKEFTL